MLETDSKYWEDVSMVDACSVDLLRGASTISAELPVVKVVLRALNLSELEDELIRLELGVNVAGSPVDTGENCDIT